MTDEDVMNAAQVLLGYGNVSVQSLEKFGWSCKLHYSTDGPVNPRASVLHPNTVGSVIVQARQTNAL
jgi:hypothetical protein